MNTHPNLLAASVSSSRDNPCFGTDPSVATLNVFTDDEHSYQLPYAQFLYAELTPNPALERDAEASPERLRIAFAVAEVVIFGCGLNYLERAIQKFELKFVKPVSLRYAAVLKTHAAEVTVNLTKEIT